MSAPINTITWWELPTTDLDAAKEFYSTVFGWAFVPIGEDEGAYAGIMNGPEMVGGLFTSDTAPGDPGVRVYVNVPDLEATLGAAEAAGGSVKVPRTEVGGDMGWWAEITAPDGHWLGLCTGAPAREG